MKNLLLTICLTCGLLITACDEQPPIIFKGKTYINMGIFNDSVPYQGYYDDPNSFLSHVSKEEINSMCLMILRNQYKTILQGGSKDIIPTEFTFLIV